MLVNRKIVDEFLEGKDISREWIFSEIQQGEYLSDLSDLDDKQEEVKKLTDKFLICWLILNRIMKNFIVSCFLILKKNWQIVKLC